MDDGQKSKMNDGGLHISPDPYEADKFEVETGNGEKRRYWALTRKNADFIEAVVRLDSNYGWDEDNTHAPEKGYEPLKSVTVSNKSYGSTAYWFKEMGKSGTNPQKFKESLAGAICSICITNSTRMSFEERKEMAGRIADDRDWKIGKGTRGCHCSSVGDLIAMLLVEFDPKSKAPNNGQRHIFAILTQKTVSKGRYNMSFASKFCSYAYRYLIGQNNNPYSRYDQIVSKNLYSYIKFYGYQDDNPPDECDYRICQSKDKRVDSYQYRLDAYKSYCDIIDYILTHLPKGQNISRDEFDHIIWYSEK